MGIRRPVRRSGRPGPGSVLLALLLFPLTLGWLIYSFRSVEVTCQRAAGLVTCRAVERVGGVEVWSAEAGQVTGVRAQSRRGEGPAGVLLETETGAVVPLTSSVVGQDQMDAIAGRLEAWLATGADPALLSFTQGPSLANAAISGLITLMSAMWGWIVLARARRRPERNPPAARP